MFISIPIPQAAAPGQQLYPVGTTVRSYSFFRALTVSSDSCPWSTDSCPIWQLITDSCPLTCKVVFCSSFTDQDGWDPEKSWMKKQLSGSKFPKKGPQKMKKWANAQKQPILVMFWCIRVTKSGSPEFRRAVKLYFVQLLLIRMCGMLKSREIAWNQVFGVKNVDFSPNYKAFWGKMCLY